MWFFHRDMSFGGVDLCEIIDRHVPFFRFTRLNNFQTISAWTWFEYVWFQSQLQYAFDHFCLLCWSKNVNWTETLIFHSGSKNRSKCKVDLWVFKAWPMDGFICALWPENWIKIQQFSFLSASSTIIAYLLWPSKNQINSALMLCQ